MYNIVVDPNKSKKRKQPDDLTDLILPDGAKRRKIVRLKDGEIFHVNPDYDPDWSDYGGGTRVDVTLSYRAADRYNGSGPKKDACTCVAALINGKVNGTDDWIKGHLLNDWLGGHGVSWNLTPMTEVQNHHFNRIFEQPIKTALIKARQLDEAGGTPDFWYGVQLSVWVGACCAGPNVKGKAARAVRQLVTYRASWVTVTKAEKRSERKITVIKKNPPRSDLPQLPKAGKFDPGET